MSLSDLLGDGPEQSGEETTDDIVRTAELARLLWGDEQRVDATLWSDGDWDVQARHIRRDGSLDGTGVRVEERITPVDDGGWRLDCWVRRDQMVAEAVVEDADLERAERHGAEIRAPGEEER